MAKLKIVTDPEFLHKVSKPVTDFNARLHQLLDDMRETMRASGHCMGLAAVQVGVLYRVCVIDMRDGVVEFINPEIIEMQNQKVGEEGCVSVPDVGQVKVKRPHHVTVRAFDRYGKEFVQSFKKIEAVCVCHEIDHMNGILFTDHLNVEKFKNKKY